MSTRKLGIGGIATVLWVMVLGVLAFAAAPALADTAPVVTINAPTGPTATAVKVSGTVNPNGGPSTTTWGFQYSKDPETEGWTGAGGVTVSGEYAEGSPESLSVAPLAVAGTIEGLQPNSTYQLRLVATNAGGEATPEPEVTAKTLPAKPSIDSETASGVTSTAATLEAQVNPNNEPTTSIVFEYGTSKTLAGATTLKDETPLENFGDQTATVPRLEGLPAGATYYYRVIVKNVTGTETGAIKSFTTVPTPTAEAPSPLGSTTATFNGHLKPLNPNVATMYHFLYGIGGCAGAETTSEEAGTGPGSEFKVPPVAVSGLQPNAEYQVCLVATNEFAAGEFAAQESVPVPFKTLAAPPTVTGGSSSEVTATGAILSASVNPNNEETTYAFEYATSEAALGTPAATKTPGTALAASFGEQAITRALGALQPHTTYFYRAIAENAQSETELKPATGEVKTFLTLAAPGIVTGEDTEVTRTTATLAGTVNPFGAGTFYHFVYIPAAGYLPGAGECPPDDACAYERKGGGATPSVYAGAGFAPVAVEATELQNLTPGTTYHYALVANNSEGTTVGPDMTFTTLPATPPLVSTGGASEVGQFSATLAGTVDTRGLPTTSEFEVAASPTPGSGYVQNASIVPGSEAGTSVGVTFTYDGDLQPGTTYYYRTLARNADGTVAGAWGSFTTGGVPGAFTLPAGIAFVPYTPISALATNEAPVGKAPPVTKGLTNAQKLAKALTVCKKDRKKGKRLACERAAKRRYGTGKKTAKGGSRR